MRVSQLAVGKWYQFEDDGKKVYLKDFEFVGKKVHLVWVVSDSGAVRYANYDTDGMINCHEVECPKLADELKGKETGKVLVDVFDNEAFKGQFLKWLSEFIPHYSGIEDWKQYIVEEKDTEKEYVVKVRLYTEKHVYGIVAVRHKEVGRKNYLGCILNNRYWYAGEDWHRGRDLPDGDFSKEGWDNIVRAILACELVKKWKWEDKKRKSAFYPVEDSKEILVEGIKVKKEDGKLVHHKDEDCFKKYPNGKFVRYSELPLALNGKQWCAQIGDNFGLDGVVYRIVADCPASLSFWCVPLDEEELKKVNKEFKKHQELVHHKDELHNCINCGKRDDCPKGHLPDGMWDCWVDKDAEIAKSRLDSSGDEVISSEEMKKRLDMYERLKDVSQMRVNIAAQMVIEDIEMLIANGELDKAKAKIDRVLGVEK